MNPSPITQHVAKARGAELAHDSLQPARTIGDRPIKRRPRSHHLLVTGIVALAAALPLTGVAHASLEPPTVPTEIQVGDGNKVFLVGHAVGVQIYSCNAIAGGFTWGFVAPRADLYDDNGKLIVTHFGGPTWQAIDGSKVVGRRVGDGVTVDASAIPWLLLSAASTSAGLDGARLVGTTFIQRIATTGGLTPPAADCNAETAATVDEVPYTADYYFWKAKR
jgi:hypothetical protein